MGTDTERVHLSLPAAVLRWARTQAEAQHYTDLSSYVAELLRNEIRKQGVPPQIPTPEEHHITVEDRGAYHVSSAPPDPSPAASQAADKLLGSKISRSRGTPSKPKRAE